MDSKLNGLLDPGKAVKIGRGTLVLFMIVQVIAAPFVEQVGWYILIIVMPPTILALICFAKRNIFAQIYMLLFSIGIVAFVTASILFIALIMACQYNWYRHMKAGEIT